MMRFPKGFTLLSLIVGIATGAVLLLTIVQLSSLSRVNFLKNQNTIQMYVDARGAIERLRRYVPMAGVGIEQPSSAQHASSSSAASLMQYSASPSYTPTLSPGGPAVLQDWVYVGMCTGITIGTTPSYAYTTSPSNPSQPLWCANQVSTHAPSANFMALLKGNCYYGTNPGWPIALTSLYSKGLCCANPNNNGTSSCGNPTYPVYSCGASNGSNAWAASVYQKLVKHVTATTAPANGNSGGDQITVYFANRGPANMSSYDGTTIVADTNTPPTTLNSYSFIVNNTSGILQMTQTINGVSATYTVANNVEYMAVLAGESDRIDSNNATFKTASQPMQLPEMNRYVRFNAANLYPYRITAVRIALVVRSNDNVLASAPGTPATLTLMTGSNGTPITYTPPSVDRRLRKVFVTTIYLHAYALPEFRMNCTPLPTSSSSSPAQLQTGGIPFTTITNPVTGMDQCCGGTCTSYPNYNACETQRMTNGC